MARRWLAAEPDDDMREELESLLAGGDDELAERFDGRLQFGTAGCGPRSAPARSG